MDNWSVTEWITAATALLTTACGLVFWVMFLRKSALRSQVSTGLNRSVEVRWGLVDVLVVLFVWIFSQAFALQALQALQWLGGEASATEPIADQAARMGLMLGMVQLLVLGFCMAYLGRRYGHEERDFGLAFRQWGSGLRAGLVAFTMWVPVVWIVQTALVSYFQYSHPSLDRLQQSNNPKILVDTWLTAVLIAPIVEELLFRGVLQGWLQRWSPDSHPAFPAVILGNPRPPATDGPPAMATTQPMRNIYWPAIVITSILFGLAHFSQGPAPISLFYLSLGLGYLYQRTGSLIACIVMHMMLNAITMTLFTISLFTTPS